MNFGPRKRYGIRWYGRELFDVVRYGYCPGRTEWEALRAVALRQSNVDLGDYLDTEGLVTFWSDGGVPRMIVTFNRGDLRSHEFLGVVAHEAVHVAKGLLDEMSEKEPGEETLAYMVGAISQVLLYEYEQHQEAVA